MNWGPLTICRGVPGGSEQLHRRDAAELRALADSGTIRVIDVLILTKDADGTSRRQNSPISSCTQNKSSGTSERPERLGNGDHPGRRAAKPTVRPLRMSRGPEHRDE